MRYWLRITRETTFNGGPKASPTAAEQLWIDFGTQSPNVGHTPVIWEHRSQYPSLGPVVRMAGSDAYDVAGSFSTPLFHEQAAFWNAAVFAPTSGELPSYSVDRIIKTNNAAAIIKDRYNGCKFNRCQIGASKSPQNPLVNLSLSFAGGQRIDGIGLAGYPVDPACSVYPSKLYRWGQHSLVLGGTNMDTWVNNWSIDIAHTISPQRHKNQYVDSMYWRSWNPSFSASWDLVDKTFHDKYQAIMTSYATAKLAASSLTLDYGGGDQIIFALNNMLIRTLAKQTPVGGDFSENAQVAPVFECGTSALAVTINNAV